MFEVEQTFTFEAGHVLSRHDGKCSRPHGHNYVLTIKLCSDKLIESGPKTNMVIDFFDLVKVVEPMITTYLDHHWLNDTLKSDSPTAEYIAKWIYHYLKPLLPSLTTVILYETPTSKVTYSP